MNQKSTHGEAREGNGLRVEVFPQELIVQDLLEARWAAFAVVNSAGELVLRRGAAAISERPWIVAALDGRLDFAGTRRRVAVDEFSAALIAGGREAPAFPIPSVSQVRRTAFPYFTEPTEDAVIRLLLLLASALAREDGEAPDYEVDQALYESSEWLDAALPSLLAAANCDPYFDFTSARLSNGEVKALPFAKLIALRRSRGNITRQGWGRETRWHLTREWGKEPELPPRSRPNPYGAPKRSLFADDED